jgi:hypothetical protein
MRPRFSIAGIMVAAAIAALNLTALRFLLEDAAPPAYRSEAVEVLCVGVPPMASLLALGALILYRRRAGQEKPHTFLPGFEIFGTAALLLFVALACYAPREVVDYLRPLLDLLERSIGRASPLFIPVIIATVALILTLPQLAFALMGGWLSIGYRVRIVIERRRADGPDPAQQGT